MNPAELIEGQWRQEAKHLRAIIDTLTDYCIVLVEDKSEKHLQCYQDKLALGIVCTAIALNGDKAKWPSDRMARLIVEAFLKSVEART